MPDDQMRDDQGRYRHTLDKLCVCGHSNGQHSAERYRNPAGKMEQPCFADNCECECFRKTRKRK